MRRISTPLGFPLRISERRSDKSLKSLITFISLSVYGLIHANDEYDCSSYGCPCNLLSKYKCSYEHCEEGLQVDEIGGAHCSKYVQTPVLHQEAGE